MLCPSCIFKGGGEFLGSKPFPSVFDDLDNWMNKVVFINNGKCEDKINISDFKNGNSLYQAVKSKLLCLIHLLPK